MMQIRRTLNFVLVIGISLILGLTIALVAVQPRDTVSEAWPTIAFSLIGGLTSVAAGFLHTNRRYERRNGRQVFLSYAHEDHMHAARLADALERAGYKPWLDSRELLPGQNVKDAIESAVRRSGAALFVVPPQGVGDAQQFEIERLLLQGARGLNRRVSAVLPVLVDSRREMSVPKPLSGLKWIDLSDPGWEAALARYLRAAFE